MRDRKNLYDFLRKILVFDPLSRATPRAALQHPFITSAMGNISQLTASKSTTTTTTTTNKPQQPPQQQQPQQQRPPFMNNSSSSTSQLPISPVLIFASLANVTAHNSSNITINNSSSINTSQTTEDSQEIKTPTHSVSPLLPLNRSRNNSKELITPIPKSPPKIIIQTPTNHHTTKVLTPTAKASSSLAITTQRGPLRSILKKPTSSPTNIIHVAQQENTLDSRILALYQQLPINKISGNTTIALSITSSDDNDEEDEDDYITAENTYKNSVTIQHPTTMYTAATSNVSSLPFVNTITAVSPPSSVNTTAYTYQPQQQQLLPQPLHQIINNLGYASQQQQQQAYIPTSPSYHHPQYQQQQQQQLPYSLTSYSATTTTTSRHFSPSQQQQH